MLRWFKTSKYSKARSRSLTPHRYYDQSLTAVRANDQLIWGWLSWQAGKFCCCTAAMSAKVILMTAPWEVNLAPHTELCCLCCCSIRPHTDWRHFDYQCAREETAPETLLRCNQTFIEVAAESRCKICARAPTQQRHWNRTSRYLLDLCRTAVLKSVNVGFLRLWSAVLNLFGVMDRFRQSDSVFRDRPLRCGT